MRNGIYVYKHNLLVDCEISSHGIYDIDVYYEINNENILLLTKRNYYSSSIDDIQENIINYN